MCNIKGLQILWDNREGTLRNKYLKDVRVHTLRVSEGKVFHSEEQMGKGHVTLYKDLQLCKRG